MKRREAVATLIAGSMIVLALLAVFAIELSHNQASSKSDLEAAAHQRAVLVAGLFDSVFGANSQLDPQLVAEYGAPTVTDRTLERNRGPNPYVVLLGASGRVLAASKGFTAQARVSLAAGKASAVEMVQDGLPWALGNIVPYGGQRVINFATRLSTPSGSRILVTGFAPQGLSGFITNELDKVPDVNGAHHYLLDGNGIVIGSNNPLRPPGYVFHTPTQLHVLRHNSGVINHHYFDQVTLANSNWKVLLAAPEAAFFASVSGPIHWLPWVIFFAFAIVGLLALGLARRALHATDLVVEANAKLASTNAQLERHGIELARSNAELEQFASIASHDLQEPLRKVRTFTDRVKETDAETLSERGLDYLQRASASAERMQRLVEDLLAFSRVSTQRRPFVPVDLGKLTHEVLEDLDHSVRASGAIVRAGELPTISADAPQMRQLLQNLISNALKFTRDGVAPEVDVTATVQDGSVTLVVRDNGIGFDHQYAVRIFRVFERLHGRGAYPGTGIGLALCRKIAERHGGTVLAHSVPGQGSTFTVTMQTQRTGAATEAPATRPGGASAEHEERYVSV